MSSSDSDAKVTKKNGTTKSAESTVESRLFVSPIAEPLASDKL